LLGQKLSFFNRQTYRAGYNIRRNKIPADDSQVNFLSRIAYMDNSPPSLCRIAGGKASKLCQELI
jgi:hypothetical protein